jgi:hypothetical protein
LLHNINEYLHFWVSPNKFYLNSSSIPCILVSLFSIPTGTCHAVRYHDENLSARMGVILFALDYSVRPK